MAGRGRGRGRGLSINIEALGLGRGEILPTVAHPPPLFPPQLFKPVSLQHSDDLEYMLALKQELRESFHKSPFYIKAPSKVKDIERYSDKYQPGASDSSPAWTPDWTRLPSELKERKRRKTVSAVRPSIKTARYSKDDDVSSVLEKLEQNDVKPENPDDAEGEEDQDDEEKKRDKDDEGGDDEDEEYDEEDLEEETDYNLAYFDNGEGYGDDDEDDDEGPTY